MENTIDFKCSIFSNLELSKIIVCFFALDLDSLLSPKSSDVWRVGLKFLEIEDFVYA